MENMYKRAEYGVIQARLEEPRRFIQVIIGGRQTGKSTVIKQVLAECGQPFQLFSADEVPTSDKSWISNCWASTRNIMDGQGLDSMLLVIDEVQKITNWSEAVKKEWDSDTFNDRNIKVVLLGSSRVFLERGLSESLAGRFEEIRMGHWSYAEMRDCFGLSLEKYIYFGGYPGAASLIDDLDRFQQYIQSAIVDATIHRDILMDSPIGKPALLRQAFELGAAYSGELLSLNKMLGSLQDAGNTVTLAGYINLLNESVLLGGLQKFHGDMARRRASVPKFQVYDNALKTIYDSPSFERALSDHKTWGRLVESCVGTHLLNLAFTKRFEVFYWRDGDAEVDFVLRKNGSIIALEVKSNAAKNTAGLDKFKQMFHPTAAFVVGDGGIPLRDFLAMDISRLF